MGDESSPSHVEAAPIDTTLQAADADQSLPVTSVQQQQPAIPLNDLTSSGSAQGMDAQSTDSSSSSTSSSSSGALRIFSFKTKPNMTINAPKTSGADSSTDRGTLPSFPSSSSSTVRPPVSTRRDREGCIPCKAFTDRLMPFYKDSGEAFFDKDFALKTLESIHKKIKKQPDMVTALFTAMGTQGKDHGGCVLIPRSLDGRLQVTTKKILAHYHMARMFRFGDCVAKYELKSIASICPHGYDQKPEPQSQTGEKSNTHMCINPWHYERVVSPSTSPSPACTNSPQKETSSPTKELQQSDILQSTTCRVQPDQPLPSPMPKRPCVEQPDTSAAAAEAPLHVITDDVLYEKESFLEQLRAGRRKEAQMWQRHNAEKQRLLQVSAAEDWMRRQAAAALLVARPPAPGEAASDEYQNAWELTYYWWFPHILSAWKEEERRLLKLEQPRFMPDRNYKDVDAWCKEYTEREINGLPGVDPESFDDIITRPIPDDDEKMGYLMRHFPERRKQWEMSTASSDDDGSSIEEQEEEGSASPQIDVITHEDVVDETTSVPSSPVASDPVTHADVEMPSATAASPDHSDIHVTNQEIHIGISK